MSSTTSSWLIICWALRDWSTAAARDWDASVWGRNMLDEEYYSWGLDIPTLGGYAGIVAPEATYGITLRWFK
jgi:iron complex outermembrane receptor protein